MSGNAPSVTNTFVANTKAKSSEVNKNFQDLVDALTLGTKDITIGTTYYKTAATNTAAHTLTSIDSIRTLFINNSAASTVFLPTAASNSGRIVGIKKINDLSGTLTIDANGSETIDSTLTISILDSGYGVEVQSDGSNWHTLSPKEATENQSGIVKVGAIPGITDGVAAAAGKVGELIEEGVVGPSSAGATGVYGLMDSIDLTPGEWDIYIIATFDQAGVSTYSKGFIAFGTTINSDSGTTLYKDKVRLETVVDAQFSTATLTVRVNISVADTYYLNGQVFFTGSAPNGWFSFISARRVR